MPRTVGQFEIVSRLGSGGMGEVHLAHALDGHPLLDVGTPVALKLLPGHGSAAEPNLARFVREARAGMLVEHPHVAQTLDVGLVREGETRIPYIATEFVEGESLTELRERLGRLPESLCLHIAHQAAQGLAAIHEAGLVHRDIKPSNLMLTKTEEVKLVDLGVALFDTPAAALTMEGAFVGTRRFAAPEQREGAGTIDARADLYALGATLLELATGRAFPGPGSDGRVDIQAHVRSPVASPGSETVASTETGAVLSPFFTTLLETLLEPAPDGRFEDARALVEALTEGEKGAWYQSASALASRPRAAPTRLLSAGQPTPLLGREAELDTLAALHQRAREGAGGAHLLLGETGIGKSRLLDAFLATATGLTEHPPLIVRTAPGTGGDGMRAFLDAVVERYPAASLGRAVKRLLAPYPGLARGFLAAAGGTETGEEPATLGASALRASCVHLVRAMARSAPLVLVMEDIHGGGSTARELFAAFAALAPTEALLLLGTARSQPIAPWLDELSGSRGLSLKRLEPLPRERMAYMARALCQDQDVTASALAHAVDLAAGNPLFLIELVQALRIEATDGGGSAPGLPGLPQSLKGSLLRRIGALSRAERELLELAACIGFEFDPALLASAHARTTGATGTTFFAITRELATIRNEHGLIRDAGRTFAFDHALLHETLYTETPQILREQIHALVAELLTEGEGEGDPSGAQAHEIVRHWLRAGRPGACVPYLEPALRHLERRSAHAQMFEILEEVLDDPALADDPRRAELEMRLIEASRAGGRLGADSDRIARSIKWLREADRTDLLPRALVAAGQGAILRESLEEAVSLFEEATTRARDVGDTKTLAAAGLQLGRVALYRHEHEAAEAAFQSVLDSPAAETDPLIRARALGSLALVPSHDGAARDPEALLRECADIARSEGDSEVLATALGNLTFVISQRGEFDACADLAREMLEIARQAGDRIRETFALGNLAAFERARGDYVASDDALIESLQVSREIGDAHGETLALLNMGANATDLGDLDTAKDHLDHAEARIQAGEDLTGLATLSLFRADWLLRAGAFEEAAEAARRSFGHARDPVDQATALTVEGWALAQGGDVPLAAERLRHALAIAEESPTTGARVATTLRLALLGEEAVEEAGARHREEASLLPIAERIWCTARLHELTDDPALRDEAADLVRRVMTGLPEQRAERVRAANPDWDRLLTDRDA